MITLDQDGCIGCGACVSICPHSFAMDESGRASVISQDNLACARPAVDICPVKVISIS